MENQQMKTLVKGALILSVASFIAKLLSAIYRVPFQNLVGDTGFYVYQQIYPIYGIGMTLSLSGLPLFLSKLIAEEKTTNAKRNVVKQSLLILAVVGVMAFAVLLLFSNQIAIAMDDYRLAPIIRSVSFMFLLIPGLSVSRGYFQGTFDMIPTATSQVTEQLIRVAVILLAAALFTPMGWSVYTMGTVAMSGAAIGGGVACFFLAKHMQQAILYDRLPGMKGIIRKTLALPGYRKLIRRFIIEGGSICLFAGMLILMQLVDSFTVKRALVSSGIPELTAQSLKGIYDRGQPLVQLGLVVGMAFSSTLLPGLTNALVKMRFGEFYRTGKSMIRISLAISMAATCGIIILMPMINQLLFGDTNDTGTLQLYMFSILFVTLINTYNSVLQSLNNFKTTTYALLFGLLVKVMLNTTFVESFGTSGASLITVFALAVTFLIVFMSSPFQLKYALFEKGYIFKLVSIMIIMSIGVGLSSVILTGLFPSSGRLTAGLIALIAIVVGVLIFCLFAVWFRLFTLREWLVFPGGKKILKKLSKHKR